MVAQGKKYVEEELSMYYLTLEVAEMTPGMMVAIGEENWKVFRTMSQETFAATLVDLARHLDPQVQQAQAWAEADAAQENQW